MSGANPELTDPNFLQDIVAGAMRAGATAATVSASSARSVERGVRGGQIEERKQAEQSSLQLTVYVEQSKASVQANCLSPKRVSNFAAHAVAIGKHSPANAYAGLPAIDMMASGDDSALDINDPFEPDGQTLEQMAFELADVTTTQGAMCDNATISWGRARSCDVDSHGLARSSISSRFGARCSAIASGPQGKERGYAGRFGHWRDQLPALGELGREAAERANAQLGARKLQTCTAAVVFDQPIAINVFGPLLSAMRGSNLAAGRSFLKTSLGEQVLPNAVSIIDDPLERRGRGSCAWDGEGVKVKARPLVEAGMIKTWLLDCASARQLGSTSTGHSGGPYNLTVSPGQRSREDLMRDAERGLLVTAMFSPSLNIHNGDWSVGVAGFWFEGGETCFPVSEVTIAGNLREIYPEIVVASDLEIRSAWNSPSILAPSMSIGGA